MTRPALALWLKSPGANETGILATMNLSMTPYQLLASYHPEISGMALVALHHDRKAAAEDFVGTVSGTNGIAGAADTVVVLNRRRTENTGRFLVTGRDVTENEYAVAMDGCRWTLAGNSLASAAEAAEEDRATANLGDRSADVLRFIGQHPDGVRADEVAVGLGLDREQSRVYLNRLLDAGKVTRPSRGVYKPTVTCVTSVTFPDPEVPERNTRNTRNTTYTEDSEPDAKCTVCGGRLIISEIGQTTHPGCEGDQ